MASLREILAKQKEEKDAAAKQTAIRSTAEIKEASTGVQIAQIAPTQPQVGENSPLPNGAMPPGSRREKGRWFS